MLFGPDWQKRTKQTNREKIIRELEKEPKRFTDLQKSAHLSPAGMTKILDELVKEKIIENTIHNGKAAYSLTEKGHRYRKPISILLSDLLELEEKGASYQQLEDTLGRGLSLHTIIGVEGKDIQYLPRMGDVRSKIYQLALKYFYGKNLPNKPIQGKVILALEIDYTK